MNFIDFRGNSAGRVMALVKELTSTTFSTSGSISSKGKAMSLSQRHVYTIIFSYLTPLLLFARCCIGVLWPTLGRFRCHRDDEVTLHGAITGVSWKEVVMCSFAMKYASRGCFCGGCTVPSDFCCLFLTLFSHSSLCGSES